MFRDKMLMDLMLTNQLEVVAVQVAGPVVMAEMLHILVVARVVVRPIRVPARWHPMVEQAVLLALWVGERHQEKLTVMFL